MRNSAAKRIIAVLLCLVVFAGSELTGLTNIVGDLFAEETTTGTDDSDRDNVVEDVEVEAQSEEPQEDTEETVEEEPEEDPVTEEPETQEEDADSEENSGDEDVTDVQETTEDQENESEGEAADNDDSAVTDDTNKNDEETEVTDETQEDADPQENSADEENAADKENTDSETETSGNEENIDNGGTPAEGQITDGEEIVTDETAETKTDETEEKSYPAFEGDYSDDQVKISVEAEEGILPEDVILSVTPIVKQDVEELEAQEDVAQEEIDKAKEINEKYEETREKLEASIPEDDVRNIAGFIAYDLAFFAPDQEGELEEIEPEGQVGVSMVFEEPYLPEEVSDNTNIRISSIDVVHMNETEEGLEAETLSDALVESTEESKVGTVEFSSDAFSVYAVAWTREGLTLEYEDEDVKILVEEQQKGSLPEGAVLNVIPVTEENEETKDQYLALESKLQESTVEEEKVVEGFFAYNLNLTDEEQVSVEPQGNVKVRMEYKQPAVPEGVVAEATDVSVGMMNLNSDLPAEGSIIQLADTEKVETEEQKLQSAELETDSFEPVLLAAWRSQMTVTIEDDIMKNGCLKVNLGADSALEGQNLYYVWYKCVGSEAPVRVEREKFGNEYSIESDGSWLNVLLTGGALHKAKNGKTAQEQVSYYVEVYNQGGTAPLATSDRYQVRYWDELQNGSFETPVISPADGSHCFDQLAITSEGLIWSTTGSDQMIELIRPDINENAMNTAYHWVANCYTHDENGNSVRVDDTPKGTDGLQFAELNCEASGALYQDVLTMPGETLNYWLSHRARSTTSEKHANRWIPENMEKDYMYIVIAPTEMVQNISTQEQLQDFISKNRETEGVFIERYEGNNWAWTDHEGTFTPTSYLTRFFFVADTTSSGDPTVGNFLDNVGFSQELPPAEEGKFDLEITKTIKGLELEDTDQDGNLSQEEIKQGIANKLGNLTFEITAEYPIEDFSGTVVAPCTGDLSITADGWEWSINADGSYTGSFKYKNQEMNDPFGIVLQLGYIYKIQEKNPDVESYDLNAELNILGGTELRGDNSVLIKQKDAVSFRFTNTYTSNIPQPTTTTLKIRKVWEDNNDALKARPSQIKIRLQYKAASDEGWTDFTGEGQEEAAYTLESKDSTSKDPNQWEFTIEGLPDMDMYQVTEIEVDERYVSPESIVIKKEDIQDNLAVATITNTLKTYSYDWQIVKRGSTAESQLLEGAEFTLTSKSSQGEQAKVYYGKSQEGSGVIRWFENDSYEEDKAVNISDILPGEYELAEIKAPAGFIISGNHWTINLDYETITVRDSSGEINVTPTTENGREKYEYTFLNEAVYELPSTGGAGIFGYMISGVLLMMAGVLVLYKRKYAGRC